MEHLVLFTDLNVIVDEKILLGTSLDVNRNFVPEYTMISINLCRGQLKVKNICNKERPLIYTLYTNI